MIRLVSAIIESVVGVSFDEWPSVPITPVSGGTGFSAAAAALLDADHLTGPLVADDSSGKRLSMGKYESGKSGSLLAHFVFSSKSVYSGINCSADCPRLESVLIALATYSDAHAMHTFNQLPRTHPTGSRSTSSLQLSADAAAPSHTGGAEGIVMEGTLAKVGKTFAQFVERHYAIRSNFLYAFKSKDDVQPNRVHFLEGCFIEVRVCCRQVALRCQHEGREDSCDSCLCGSGCLFSCRCEWLDVCVVDGDFVTATRDGPARH